MSDLLTPAELAAIAEREAKVTPPVVYFINSPDTGFDEYPTLKEALDAAEETISNYRYEAIDGWNEEVTSIRVGIITHDVEQFDVKHRKDCGEDENWACSNCDEMCDYRMSSDGDLLALLNVARADRAALLRHIAALEADLADLTQTTGELCPECHWRGVRDDGCEFCKAHRLEADLAAARKELAGLEGGAQ